jgi:hypothetical protein
LTLSSKSNEQEKSKMEFETESPIFYAAVQAMIPLLEGLPCVHVSAYDGVVFHCRRLHDLHIDYESFAGVYDWVEPDEERPDELTAEFFIGYDCLQIGDGWFYDSYFQWYTVFDPNMVALSDAGDDSWVSRFTVRNKSNERAAE